MAPPLPRGIGQTQRINSASFGTISGLYLFIPSSRDIRSCCVWSSNVGLLTKSQFYLCIKFVLIAFEQEHLGQVYVIWQADTEATNAIPAVLSNFKNSVKEKIEKNRFVILSVIIFRYHHTWKVLRLYNIQTHGKRRNAMYDRGQMADKWL